MMLDKISKLLSTPGPSAHASKHTMCTTKAASNAIAPEKLVLKKRE